MRTKSPSKKKESEPEPKEPLVCPECGMDRGDWANKGKGVVHDEIMYCCRGCANGGECVCE